MSNLVAHTGSNIVAAMKSRSVSTRYYSCSRRGCYDGTISKNSSVVLNAVLNVCHCRDYATETFDEHGGRAQQQQQQSPPASQQHQYQHLQEKKLKYNKYPKNNFNYKSIKEIQLANFTPRRLSRWQNDYIALEAFVMKWRKEQAENTKLQQSSTSTEVVTDNSNDKKNICKKNKNNRYYPPIPTEHNLKIFLDRERANIRRDALLHGYDSVELRVKVLNKLGYSLLPGIDRWNRHYGQLINHLSNHNWQFPYDCEWDLTNKIEIDLFNWCRKQRFMYRVYNASIGKCSSTREVSTTFPNESMIKDAMNNHHQIVDNINEGLWKNYISEGNWKLLDTVNCTINVALTLERIDKLNEIGFVWNSRTKQWDTTFLLLKNYYIENGHCLVPLDYSINNVSLGGWVARQRVEYEFFTSGKAKTRMTPDRINQLNSINFCWKGKKNHYRNNNKGKSSTRTGIIQQQQQHQIKIN
jgi:Helicase associated domain